MRRLVSVPSLGLAVLLFAVGAVNAQLVELVSTSRGPVGAESRKPDRPMTLSVDCTRGQSINKALGRLSGQSDTESVIEIHGICEENVLVRGLRNVVLRGTDPEQDGITSVGQEDLTFPRSTALFITDSWVRVENLSLAGWRPLRVNHSDLVDIVNCELYTEDRAAFFATHAQVNFIDTTIASPSLAVGGGWMGMSFTNTTVSGNFGVAVWGAAEVMMDNSHVIAGAIGIYGIEGSFVQAQDSTVESTNAAVYAAFAGNIWLYTSEMAGRILSGGNSSVVLVGVTQTASGGDHFVSERSALWLGDGSQLLGSIQLYDFSSIVIPGGNSVLGELHCGWGADAFCEDPGDIWGAYGCASIPWTGATGPSASSIQSRQDLSSLRMELQAMVEEERLD